MRLLVNYKMYLDSFPDDKRALNGIESCNNIKKWIDEPSRFQVVKFKGY